MAIDELWGEDINRYRTSRLGAMLIHHRFYKVGRQAVLSQAPARGEVLSGSGVTADRLLAVTSSSPTRSGVAHLTEITSFVPQGTSVAIGGNTLLRLEGFPKQRDTGTGTEYTLRYASDTQSDLPSFGDTYVQDSEAVTGDVFVDPDALPGLFVGTMTFNTTRER